MRVSKIWLASVIVAASFSPLCAQNPNAAQPAASATQNLNRLDSSTSGQSVRVSKLIGMSIQNSANQNVGQIKDIVIDPSSDRVQYVAVTYGGFLGLGNNLFAVPMQAIQIKQNPNNRDSVMLFLDVTKEQMDGDVGFDENNWPNFSDGKFAGEINRRYKVEDRRDNGLNRRGPVDVNVDSNGVKVNVDGLRK